MSLCVNCTSTLKWTELGTRNKFSNKVFFFFILCNAGSHVRTYVHMCGARVKAVQRAERRGQS